MNPAARRAPRSDATAPRHGVVVDHLHQQPGVVDAGERLQGPAHQLDGLVVGGDLQRHPGQLGVRRRRPGGFWTPSQHVDDLEGVGHRERQRGDLEEEQEGGGERRPSSEIGGVGLQGRVDEVGQRCQDHHGEELRRRPAPSRLEQAHQRGRGHRHRPEDHRSAGVTEDHHGEPRGERERCQLERQGDPEACGERPWDERREGGGSQREAEEDEQLQGHDDRSAERRGRLTVRLAGPAEPGRPHREDTPGADPRCPRRR